MTETIKSPWEQKCKKCKKILPECECKTKKGWPKGYQK